jgi:hypothetical protein
MRHLPTWRSVVGARASRPLSGIGDASKPRDRSSADVHSGSAKPAIAVSGIGPK